MAVNLEDIAEEQRKILVELKIRTMEIRTEYLSETKDYRVEIAEARKRYLIGNEK